MSETARDHYFVPESAKWPMVGSIALTANNGWICSLPKR